MKNLKKNTLIKKNILFFFDQAYYLFYNRSYISYAKQFDNLIVTRTFSKAWGTYNEK